MASTSLSLALSPLLRPTPRPQLQPRPLNPKFPKPLRLILTAVAPSRASPLAAVPDGVAVDDVVEKDWSFLDATRSHLPRALAAGALSPASRVLAVTPTASFVDALLSESPCELLVAAHESLYVLAGIKEEHDEVRCFHLEGGGGGRGGGVVEAVPKRFDAFDAVFVCYFPGMGVSAAALLNSLAKRCSKARERRRRGAGQARSDGAARGRRGAAAQPGAAARGREREEEEGQNSHFAWRKIAEK